MRRERGGRRAQIGKAAYVWKHEMKFFLYINRELWWCIYNAV